MFKKKESTRLGQILVSKGLITPEQLAIATHEQTKRNRLLNTTDVQAPRGVMIGEILVEFGYIDQLELKRGLNWQQRLRHVSIAMALCAPFMAFAPVGASAQTTSSSSSAASSSKNFTPITIQAENYSSMSGIQTETTTDTDGGLNVGYIDAGDWLSYSNTSVNIPTAGTYKITFRVASLSGGGNITLKEAATDAALDTFSIPLTGGWQTWVDVVRTVYLSQGTHSFKVQAVAGGFNLNWLKVEAVAPTTTTTTTTSTATSSGPYGLTIQAENFSAMSGVQNETTTDTGGGQNTGYIDAGDWMSYTDSKFEAPVTGSYKITFRVASLNGGGSLVLREASTDAALDTFSVPQTGGWQVWTDVVRTVNLTQGTHTFKLYAAAGGFNVNWFKVEVIPTPLPLTIQAENYASMFGIQTETTTDTGGGLNVGYIDVLDWMSYTNVDVMIAATGNYKMTYRVASLNGGGSFTIGEAGSATVYDTVSVPQTGGWQTWTNVERIVSLPAGKHNFAIKALVGGFNLNWFKLEPWTSPTSSTSSSAAATGTTTTTSSAASSSAPSTTSSASSSAASSVISSVASSVASSAPSYSSSSASSNSNHVAGPVALSWSPPVQRENGAVLDITELGGYELRYKQDSDNTYTYVTINDAWTTQQSFTWLEGNYTFQVAAFDKNGIYSNFTNLFPR